MTDVKRPDFGIKEVEIDEVSDHDLKDVSGGSCGGCNAMCEGHCGACMAPPDQL